MQLLTSAGSLSLALLSVVFGAVAARRILTYSGLSKNSRMPYYCSNGDEPLLETAMLLSDTGLVIERSKTVDVAKGSLTVRMDWLVCLGLTLSSPNYMV